MSQRNVLLEAHDIIFGDREKTYGRPEFNLETIAEFWRIYIERKHNVMLALLPEDICQMMILLKIARLINDPQHRDSLTDLAGYAGLQDRINQFNGQMEFEFIGKDMRNIVVDTGGKHDSHE